MKKTVIFHALFLLAFIAVVSVPTYFTAVVFVLSVFGLYKYTRHMTVSEIYTVTGANFYNKLFNTNDFTKE